MILELNSKVAGDESLKTCTHKHTGCECGDIFKDKNVDEKRSCIKGTCVVFGDSFCRIV